MKNSNKLGAVYPIDGAPGLYTVVNRLATMLEYHVTD